jgi:hypothetical protein
MESPDPNIKKWLKDKKVLVIPANNLEESLSRIYELQKHIRRQSKYYTNKCYYGEYKTKKGEERGRKRYRALDHLHSQLSYLKEDICALINEKLREEGLSFDERMKVMEELGSKYFW